MKKIVLSVSVLGALVLSVLVFVRLGPVLAILGLALLLVSMFLAWRAIKKILHKITLISYARQIDDIVVYSLSEDDDTVFLRAQKERSLLKESGNQLEVQVHEIYFRDYLSPSESWEEFRERLRAYEIEIKKARHEKLNSWISRKGGGASGEELEKRNREWFLKNVLHQKGAYDRFSKN